MSTYLADKAEDLTVEGPSARFTYRRMGPQGGVPLILLHRRRKEVVVRAADLADERRQAPQDGGSNR